MAIPTIKEFEIPLLHLIQVLGGEACPSDTFSPLANYFKLSEEERNELTKSELMRRLVSQIVHAKHNLVIKGYLDSSKRGVWKITETGKKELLRKGLLDKPFPLKYRDSYKNVFYRLKIKFSSLTDKDKELIQMVIREVLPHKPKTFPIDFINNYNNLIDLVVPGTKLSISTYLKTLVTSPRGYFKYKARNPSEAKYIVYANKIGQKKIKIPKDNFLIFKAVKSYEKYITNIIKQSFELFLYFTSDEYKAERLTKIVKKELGLKEKI